MEEVMVNVRTLQKYDVANKLKEVNSSKAYLDMGYQSITEYAEKELGYKPAMTYNLIRIAENFLEEGKTQTLFVSPDGEDYNISQLQELLKLDHNTILKLIKDCKINPSMKTKEIREIVKSVSMKGRK